MGWRINFSGRLPKFGKKGFNTELNKMGEIQIKQAARAWLRAVIQEIPTYTGTARGTFKPLGAFLKVAIPAGTKVSTRTSKKIKGQTYQLGFGAGAQYGQDFEFVQKGLRFEFNYTVNLPYIWWNSFGPGLPELRKAAPWMAIQQGTEAFEAYLRENLPGRLAIIFSRHMTGKAVR